jgi:hypothetical protein
MDKRHESLLPITEVRDMIAVARRFVQGEATILDLYGGAVACEYWARNLGMHAEIAALAAKWRDLAEAHWNEFGMLKNPPTRAEVCAELLRDLGELE